jgi:hypothetical protein
LTDFVIELCFGIPGVLLSVVLALARPIYDDICEFQALREGIEKRKADEGRYVKEGLR